MANTLLNVDKITNAALVILHQKLNFVGSINRTYDSSFAVDGAKIGSTLRIRLPNQYTVRTGNAMSIQDTVENSVPLAVATQKGVDANFTTTELSLNIFDFSQQVLEPAMAALAAVIEADALNMATDLRIRARFASAANMPAQPPKQGGTLIELRVCRKGAGEPR